MVAFYNRSEYMKKYVGKQASSVKVMIYSLLNIPSILPLKTGCMLIGPDEEVSFKT